MTTQSKNKKKLLIKTTVGILLTVSAVGYVFSGFSQYITHNTDTVIRTINHQDITQSRITQERDALAQRLGSVPQDSMIRQQIINQALENVTLQTAISLYAQSLGVRASDSNIAKILQSIKPFTDKNGDFDKMAFKRILQSQGISVKAFKNNIADGVVRENYTTPMVTEFPLSQKVTSVFNDFAFTKIKFTAYTLDFKNFSTDAQKIIPPTEEQLKQIYTEKKETLKRPTLKDIEYAAFNSETLKDTVSIDPKDITDFYTKNKNTLYVTAEKRKILQIVFDDEKQARSGYEKLTTDKNFEEKYGENFKAVAKELGYKMADIDLGLITADALTDDKTVQEKVFSSNVGKALKPIKTDFGYAIYFIESIQPETVKTFESVKSEIQENIFQKKLSDYLIKITPKVDDDLAGGASLSEITAHYGSGVISKKNIASDGTIYDTKDPKRLNPLIPLNDVNDYNVGDDIPMIALDNNGFALLKITNSQAERPLTFDEAKESLLTADINAQKKTLLTEAANLLKQPDTRQSIVEKYNITPKEYAFSRSDTIPSALYRPDFEKIIFATKPEQNFSYIDDNSALVLIVNAVTPPEEIDETKADDFAATLQKNYTSVVQDNALQMIRHAVTIETNQDALNSFLIREAGH